MVRPPTETPADFQYLRTQGSGTGGTRAYITFSLEPSLETHRMLGSH